LLFVGKALQCTLRDMRINSGILGRRTFKVPKEGLRPTMEQAREGVFSSLAARIPGARVLDLFAGSGGLGLEAWSRGAASVTAVEKVSKHWKILQENFQALDGDPDLGSWQAIHADVYEFLKRGADPFDLIFADPPYEEADLPRLLEVLRDVLAPGGILVFEMRSREPYSMPPDWNLIKEKRYGGTRMLFLEPPNE
jgi:16S rRNA (guanine966-N2)-methyltransferase